MKRKSFGVLAVTATALLVAGCARTPLTAAPTNLAPAHVTAAPAPPSRPAAPGGLLGTLQGVDSSLTAIVWQPVAAIPVLQGVDTVVTAGRYTLRFSKGSLLASALITIQDYDQNVIDVQFGPDGTQFGTPVELSIDFSGTACDPGGSYATAPEPVLYWLNEAKNQWEVVPGVTDWAHLRYVAHLEHFSRYALGGKAGWKQAPSRDADD